MLEVTLQYQDEYPNMQVIKDIVLNTMNEAKLPVRYNVALLRKEHFY